MNKQVKELWLKALRGEISDENGNTYEQAKECLKNENGFCCLGVLCDLHRLNAQCGLEWDESDMEYCQYNDIGDFLTEMVSGWAQLSHAEQHKLANMNDNGSTFGQIADYIEEL